MEEIFFDLESGGMKVTIKRFKGGKKFRKKLVSRLPEAREIEYYKHYIFIGFVIL